MKLVVWISGIEQPKIVEAHTWKRIGDNGVMFQDKDQKNLGMVQGTFAIFNAVLAETEEEQ
jgi:hypothetical protein